MRQLLCGIDIGGTFTDCVVVDEGGAVVTAKAPSTPPDFSDGIVSAMESAARKIGMDLPALCSSLALLSHGTTVGTNALIQKRGSKIGLITTKGHEHAIHIMRGSRGLTGLDLRKLVHYSESSKPEPIVPKKRIMGVSERVDCFGRVVAPLNEGDVRTAVERLVAEGVEAIAVCYLWSFLRPDHERRTRDIIREMAPDVFVTTSSELVPKWGEYERTTAVALNGYIGPAVTRYLQNLESTVGDLGYRRPLQITQSAGGTISLSKAVEAPLLTLDSGPVAGVTGSLYLGKTMGYPNIITTDMGGTSFDVGIIHEGKPKTSYVSLVNQYEYFLPKVDIQTIGAGGGSMAWVDGVTGTLHVGPDSAGAVPGPVCYGRGGSIPTVTDANLVMGFLDAENFAGGQMRLDREAARSAISELAGRLGLGVDECAAGIARIAEFKMADLIRRITIGKGLEPRDFVLFAFGGAGPLHAGVLARELGIAKVVIPQRETASAWCAFGAAAADILHIYEKVDIMSAPFDPARINRHLEELRESGRGQLAREGVATGRYAFSIDARHRGQIHEVEVPIPTDRLSPEGIERLARDFFELYEVSYGRGSSFRRAGIELVTFRCRASAETPKPRLVEAEEIGEGPAAAATGPSRDAYWSDLSRWIETPVFWGEELLPGNRVAGPAIVEMPDTTVAVHLGQVLRVDRFGNFELNLPHEKRPT